MKQQKLLDLIQRMQDRYPDWRLGQLLLNAAEWADRDLWDLEDSELFESLESHLKRAETHSLQSVC